MTNSLPCFMDGNIAGRPEHRDERPQRLAAVADGILLGGRHFGALRRSPRGMNTGS